MGTVLPLISQNGPLDKEAMLEALQRFFRAFGVPDGVISEEAKFSYAARELIKPSRHVDANPTLAVRTAVICLRYVRDRYLAGELDHVILALETVEAEATRITAALDDGLLREGLSGRGAIQQPTFGVADVVVAESISRLRSFVLTNPIDDD